MATPNYNELVTVPSVRHFLDIIARSEGTLNKGDNGYNVLFGGNTFNSYAAHPNVETAFTQTDGKKNVSSAAGRYQILTPTANELSNQLGLKDFSPVSQDKMALALINQHGALDDVLTGNYEQAINKLGNVWASLPSSNYPQPKNTMEQVLGNQTVPTQPVMQNGQQMLAVPTNDAEVQYMNSFEQAGHSPAVQAALTQALGHVTAARTALAQNNQLFDALPTDLDGELMDLIKQA